MTWGEMNKGVCPLFSFSSSGVYSLLLMCQVDPVIEMGCSHQKAEPEPMVGGVKTKSGHSGYYNCGVHEIRLRAT